MNSWRLSPCASGIDCFPRFPRFPRFPPGGQVKGKCADKVEAPIIVSNHVSPFEPLYLVGKTMATPVQRVEDSRIPIVGTIQKAMQVKRIVRSIAWGIVGAAPPNPAPIPSRSRLVESSSSPRPICLELPVPDGSRRELAARFATDAQGEAARVMTRS